MPLRRAALVTSLVLTASAAAPMHAVELQNRTIEAFNRYVQLAERQPRSAFLWVDTQPEPKRTDALQALRRGEFLIERLTTTDAGRTIPVPDGLVHHWLGAVFAPGVRLEEAVALLQDYDRHARIYSPNVARSTLRSRDGDRFDFHLRFFMKKVITVVVNSEHRAHFTREGPDRVSSRIYSTRIAEVENPGEPDERERPVGDDGGYLWRLNSYWRFLERDGGVYIQSESISLTRDIPWWGYVAKPFVTGIPRDTLTFTLETTRRTLTKRAS
jgi:hypothetical protein